MTNEELEKIIKTIPLNSGNLLDDGTSYYASKIIKYPTGEEYLNEFIILTDGKGKRVGGMYYMGPNESHIYILPKYRGMGYMSRASKDKIYLKRFPDSKKASIICRIGESRELIEKRIYLAKTSGLEISNMDEINRYFLQLEKWEKKYKQECVLDYVSE